MRSSRARITNRHITIDGETKLLVEWSEMYSISVPLILDRLKRGWDVEKAITKPARKYACRRGSENDDGQE